MSSSAQRIIVNDDDNLLQQPSCSSLPCKPKKKKTSTTRFYDAKYLKQKSDGSEEMSRNHTAQNCSTSRKTNSIINPRQYFREAYGPFLCTLLIASVMLVVLGSVLALSGYYAPRLSMKDNVGKTVNQVQAINIINQHNEMLNALRITGLVLLVMGTIGIGILFIAPMICLRRTEYTLLPDDEDMIRARSSFSSTHSGLPEDMFTFSVVKQHIQPGEQKTKASRAAQHRANYNKGFLSPELNRGPIFVSDENFKLKDRDGRFRSSSFDARLSPQPPYRQKRSLSGHNIARNLTPEMKRLIPVKAGSFHSIR